MASRSRCTPTMPKGIITSTNQGHIGNAAAARYAPLRPRMPLVSDSPDVRSVSSRPRIPDRVEDLGISRAVVGDLILRYLWLHGSASLTALNRALKLSFP